MHVHLYPHSISYSFEGTGQLAPWNASRARNALLAQEEFGPQAPQQFAHSMCADSAPAGVLSLTHVQQQGLQRIFLSELLAMCPPIRVHVLP